MRRQEIHLRKQRNVVVVLLRGIVFRKLPPKDSKKAAPFFGNPTPTAPFRDTRVLLASSSVAVVPMSASRSFVPSVSEIHTEATSSRPMDCR